jgi:putative ATPase
MSKSYIPHEPLAERVRPKSLDDIKGQHALLGKGKPLRLMIENDTVSSFMLWGPPGQEKQQLPV